jgi:hypothetical protein
MSFPYKPHLLFCDFQEPINILPDAVIIDGTLLTRLFGQA